MDERIPPHTTNAVLKNMFKDMSEAGPEVAAALQEAAVLITDEEKKKGVNVGRKLLSITLGVQPVPGIETDELQHSTLEMESRGEPTGDGPRPWVIEGQDGKGSGSSERQEAKVDSLTVDEARLATAGISKELRKLIEKAEKQERHGKVVADAGKRIAKWDKANWSGIHTLDRKKPVNPLRPTTRSQNRAVKRLDRLAEKMRRAGNVSNHLKMSHGVKDESEATGDLFKMRNDQLPRTGAERRSLLKSDIVTGVILDPRIKYNRWKFNRIANGEDFFYGGKWHAMRARRARAKVTDYIEGQDDREIDMRTKEMLKDFREEDRAEGPSRLQVTREAVRRYVTEVPENFSTNAEFARAYFESRPGRAQRNAEREAERISKLPPPPSPEGPDTPPTPDTPDRTPPRPSTGTQGNAAPLPVREPRSKSTETSTGSPIPIDIQPTPQSDEVARTTSRLKSTISSAVRVGAKIGKDVAVVGAQIFVDEVRREMKDGKPMDPQRLVRIAKELSLDPKVLSEVAAKATVSGTEEDSKLGNLAKEISARLETSRRRKASGSRAGRPTPRRTAIETTATDKN